MEPKPGEKLGPYEIVSTIGKGGMGEVWKACDTRLHRDVAIKFCANQFSDRFLREARAIAALNHPNICTLYDIGPDHLVMEYIEGAPPRGPLAPAEAVRLALGISAALEAADGKGHHPSRSEAGECSGDAVRPQAARLRPGAGQ